MTQKADDLLAAIGERWANYAIICDWELSVFFIETPKAACTSIKSYLFALKFARNGDRAEMDDMQRHPAKLHDRANSPFTRFTEFSASDRELFLTDPGVVRFCVSRNPYSRVLSAYLEKIATGQGGIYDEFVRYNQDPPGTSYTFADFIERVRQTPPEKRNNHWKHQSLLLRPDLVDYTHVLSFERLGEEFPLVSSKIKSESDSMLPEVNPHKTGASELLALYYTDALQQAVRDIYDEDFQAFGYADSLDTLTRQAA